MRYARTPYEPVLVQQGKSLFQSVAEERAKIMVSLIGAQGFVFGRGNQQISARVIEKVDVEKVGVENVIVLATQHKLS